MERKPIILGAEMAVANAAERERLAAGQTPPSPLHGRTYDVEQGECDLTRVTPLPLDAEIIALAARWRSSGPSERYALRTALSLNDNYTLIQFAKRMAVRALNDSSDQPVDIGLTAVAMIDVTRIDPRDASWAAGLLNHAATQRPGSTASLRERAASLATPEIAAILRQSTSSLSDWGYRELRTEAGTGLIRSGWSDYEPTVDLVRVAERLCAQVLAERYVCEIEVATELPSVWFDSSRRDDASRVLEHARGIVTIRGDLRRSASDLDSQMFVAWLVEMPSSDDCGRLVADVGNGSAHVGRYVIGVAAGRLFALLVAGSAEIGVRSYESASTLKQLAERTRSVLSAQSP